MVGSSGGCFIKMDKYMSIDLIFYFKITIERCFYVLVEQSMMDWGVIIDMGLDFGNNDIKNVVIDIRFKSVLIECFSYVHLD